MYDRTCIVCHNDNPHGRWGTKYCSNACRQAAYRKRRYAKLEAVRDAIKTRFAHRHKKLASPKSPKPVLRNAQGVAKHAKLNATIAADVTAHAKRNTTKAQVAAAVLSRKPKAIRALAKAIRGNHTPTNGKAKR